jgi:hypothetical protein
LAGACEQAGHGVLASTLVMVRVRGETMASQKCRIVGKSQSFIIMMNPIIFTRTRSIIVRRLADRVARATRCARMLVLMGRVLPRRGSGLHGASSSRLGRSPGPRRVWWVWCTR